MPLQFRDITDWTPASISIVDKPSHPLAVFEVYENDEEFIKKYIDPEMEGENMTQNNNPAPVNGDNVTVSGSFIERLVDRVVTKSEPVNEDDTNKQILEKLNAIEENQAKTDKRLEALENPEPADPEPPKPDDGDDVNDGDEGDGNTQNINETVELPLNNDGTLDLENEVVAKYLPAPNGSSQGVDPDLHRSNIPDKSFNKRSGRNANGMTW